MEKLPILYSFRRCPYAMRARLALKFSDIHYEWREILLKDKPPEFLALSLDATVPILVLDKDIIQESLDIMIWALQINDPNKMFAKFDKDLVLACDGDFKHNLDRYKYASRYKDGVMEEARTSASNFLEILNFRLDGQNFLHGSKLGMSDIAILPFVRQFAHVDLNWFNAQNWSFVQQWLEAFKASEYFASIMVKLPPWDKSDARVERGSFPLASK